MNEAQLLGEVLDEAQLLGIFAHHCGDSRRCTGTPGFPDLVLLGTRGVIFAELKGPATRMTLPQIQMEFRLRLVDGQRYELWRPGDWQTGRIRKQLREIA